MCNARPMERRRVLHLLAAGLAAPAVRAGDAPVLRIVVAYPPGGVSDEVARALAHQLTRRTGRTVLVEHKPGAGGEIAMDLLARAAPDGHTLVFSAITPLTLLPRLRRVAYDPRRDIAPVAGVMATPSLVAGTQALAATDFAGMVALARARPGALRWASTGVGTTGHRVLEQVCAGLHVDITHIPYPGGGSSLKDAVGGHFELITTNVAAMQLRLVADGRLKALAVGAPKRLAALPDVPTLQELGLPAANLLSHFGLFAPGATPVALLRSLNAQVNAALGDPDLQARFRAGHNLPLTGSVEAFARLVETERARP
jgi:tripartite-type tricarboxylate transporter receptor subunit TctC